MTAHLFKIQYMHIKAKLQYHISKIPPVIYGFHRTWYNEQLICLIFTEISFILSFVGACLRLPLGVYHFHFIREIS